MPSRLSTCTLCEACCGIELEVDADRVRRIAGDARDPLSAGHVCHKVMALRDVHEHPERLQRPHMRRGAQLVEVDWPVALQSAAERLHAIQRAYGRDAIAVHLGNAVAQSYSTLLYSQLFVRALRTRNVFTAASVDGLPHLLVSQLMYGNRFLVPVADIDRTDYLLIIGANPLSSNGSGLTAPGMGKRIAALRKRGGQVVVIDPRRTETALRADRHHFIVPGGDALLLMAMLHTIFAEGLAAPGRIERYLRGLDSLRQQVGPFSPDRVESAIGISATDVRSLARAFASSRRAVCYGRLGVCTQRDGSVTCWLIQALNAVTGNLDRVGGALFSRPAADLVRLSRLGGQSGGFTETTRVSGLPGYSGELPLAALAEEIETPGHHRVRALITIGANPVLSAPNGPRLERALGMLDYMVSVDLFKTATTRHADLILPPVSPLEREHYSLAFYSVAVRNVARFTEAPLTPAAHGREDWEILHGLLTRILRQRALLWRFLGRVLDVFWRHVGPRGVLNWLLRLGPYGRLLPFRRGLDLAQLRAHPHGLDFGPLVPSIPAVFGPLRRHVELAPAVLLEQVPQLALSVDELRAVRGLRLVSFHPAGVVTTWTHSCQSLKKRSPCELWMHPQDADQRALTHGQHVTLRSRAGDVRVKLCITDAVMRGVVALPFGFGEQTGRGGSVNAVTDDAATDRVSGTAAFNGVPVEVSSG